MVVDSELKKPHILILASKRNYFLRNKPSTNNYFKFTHI